MARSNPRDTKTRLAGKGAAGAKAIAASQQLSLEDWTPPELGPAHLPDLLAMQSFIQAQINTIREAAGSAPQRRKAVAAMPVVSLASYRDAEP